MKHEMDPALIKELRERVSLYKDYTDAQIALSMDIDGRRVRLVHQPAGPEGLRRAS